MDTNLSSKRYEPSFIDLSNKNDSRTLTIDLVGEGKRVLEIGTSTGYISKILKEHNNVVAGIEIDKDAGLVAKQYCEPLIIGDVENIDFERYFEPDSFDVIICSDVLEHLRNPEGVLLKLKRYLKPNGYIVVSIPNICHGDVIFRIMLGDFHYTPLGLLDKTHIRFFGLKNIYAIFSECGYSIQNLKKTIVDVGSSELKIEGNKIHPDQMKLIKSLPESNVYQYIFIAYKDINIIPSLIEEPDLVGIMSKIIEESKFSLRCTIAELLEINQKMNTEIIRKDNIILDLENKLKKQILYVRIFKKQFKPHNNFPQKELKDELF